MKKRILLAVAVPGVALLALIMRQANAPHNPMHKGKRVSQWVKRSVEQPYAVFHGTNDAPGSAVLEIGSDAVPYLISAIRRQPRMISSKFYKTAYSKLPATVSKRLPIPLERDAIIFRAYSLLAALGPAAKSSVPFLAEEFNADNRQLDLVRFALVGIGPDAVAAIPVLTNAFHSTNHVLRWTAGRTLARVQPDHPELIPAVLVDLKSTNVVSRRFACVVLGGIGPAARSAVPALTQALNDLDEGVRDNADRALRAIQQTNVPPAGLF